MSDHDSSLEEGEIDFGFLDRVEKKIQTSKEAFKVLPVDKPQPVLDIKDRCFICKRQKGKYKCPGCEQKTCSLFCSKKHKEVYNCNGKRDGASFVKLDQYSDRNAMRDYNFLSEVMRDSELIQKKLVGSTALPDALRYKLLKSHARRLLSVDLRLAPKIMERHRENISFYSVKDKLIFWCIEFTLFLGSERHRFLIDPVSQEQKIVSILYTNDIFSSEILQNLEINLAPKELIKSIKAGDIKLYYEFQEAKNFTDQEEYKFTTMKSKKRHIFRPHNQQQQAINIEQTVVEKREVDLESHLMDVVKNSRINEYPTLWLVPKKFNSQFLGLN